MRREHLSPAHTTDWGQFLLFFQGLLIQAMFEDGFNAFVTVAAATQYQGPSAGGFQASLAVNTPQPGNAKAAFYGFFRAPRAVRLSFSIACPVLGKTFWYPFVSLAVGFGHVSSDGG